MHADRLQCHPGKVHTYVDLLAAMFFGIFTSGFIEKCGAYSMNNASTYQGWRGRSGFGRTNLNTELKIYMGQFTRKLHHSYIVKMLLKCITFASL